MDYGIHLSRRGKRRESEKASAGDGSISASRSFLPTTTAPITVKIPADTGAPERTQTSRSCLQRYPRLVLLRRRSQKTELPPALLSWQITSRGTCTDSSVSSESTVFSSSVSHQRCPRKTRTRVHGSPPDGGKLHATLWGDLLVCTLLDPPCSVPFTTVGAAAAPRSQRQPYDEIM